METVDGQTQVNRYDAEGLRYEMEENGRLVQFIFSGREVAVETNDAGINRLIRGHELIISDAEYARTYYHYAADEIGSITYLTDDEGDVLNRYEYDAWGNITEQEETVPNRFKYTGQQLDPITQQYYLRARFYNPVISRFTQEDEYRDDGLNLQDMGTVVVSL
ncbi:RHS repeat-associated core domain-containing protein [Pelosinus fermentans]|uniref:RHS repeat-associated core domain containing protein-containing protein n=1 Tax=Pelosinus fermentans JBW45 TaxID=1192197 RepID=I9NXA3_9FIRM|nr:RHS repeat-associated core domain-containing protein [Pelosinus fermentans]AJQ29477.1 RHS repeat-associated core domain containing protein-containing protein [Pelosinus fermentans JBW45]